MKLSVASDKKKTKIISKNLKLSAHLIMYISIFSWISVKKLSFEVSIAQLILKLSEYLTPIFSDSLRLVGADTNYEINLNFSFLWNTM